MPWEIEAPVMEFMKKGKSALGGLLFLIRNIHRSKNLTDAPQIKIGSIVFRGMNPADEPALKCIYHSLSNNTPSFSQNILYRYYGRKLMLVAVYMDDQNKESGIVGMNKHYFNKRDLMDDTVHSGYIGVVPEFEGRGIATNLRHLAKRHFSRNRVAGISSKISLNYSGSLKSAEKAGFRPVEKFSDPDSGEDRYYLICHLN
jgi:GNAT superfamily N-acetyltransferase